MLGVVTTGTETQSSTIRGTIVDNEFITICVNIYLLSVIIIYYPCDYWTLETRSIVKLCLSNKSMKNNYLNDEIPKNKNSPINLVGFTVDYNLKIESVFRGFTIK